MAEHRHKSMLQCEEGYHFHQAGTHSVALMRGNQTTTTFTCGCDKTGGCKVNIEGSSATCSEDGCKGDCTWTIKLPGLVGALMARMA
jgi:hypothetical protein